MPSEPMGILIVALERRRRPALVMVPPEMPPVERRNNRHLHPYEPTPTPPSANRILT